MAALERGPIRFVLRHYELIGQSRFCSVVLDDEFVSGEHARIHWDGGAWNLKDLGSLNRTFIDGLPLHPGGRALLTSGMTIGFGSSTMGWTVTNVEPPTEPLVIATPVGAEGEDPLSKADQAPEFAIGGLLGLPSQQKPLLTLWRNQEGIWTVEGSPTPIRDQSIVRVEGTPQRLYRLSVPPVFGQTKPVVGLEGHVVSEASLRFLVTPDFEHIELEVSCGVVRRNLGVHRYNEILHVLARLRAKQLERGGEHDRDGWVHQDDVCKAVGDFDRERLNTEIFRARKGFAELGFVNPAQIVERRPRVGELRLGTSSFEEIVL